MNDWIKEPDFGYFTKLANLSDGAITSLLLSASGKSSSEALEYCYSSFCSICDTRNKMLGLLAVSSALTLLSYFEVLRSFSTSGIEIGGEYLKHISLMFMALVGVSYSSVETKYSYYKSLFDHVFQNLVPAEKVILLIRYPRAFDVIKFTHSSIGYPAEMFPVRQRWYLPFAILALAGIAVFLILSILLSVLVAIDVWRSEAVHPLISKSIVILFAYSSILSLLFPRYNSWRKRQYRHYGLSNLVARFRIERPEREKVFSQIIARIKLSKDATRD